MSESIFRKKSIDKISSPEQLNDYVKVANPGIWMLMIGIIILLIGVCIWGIIGRLDTTIHTVAISDSNQENAYVYISESQYEEIALDMTVVVDSVKYTIEEIEQYPQNPFSGGNISPYVLHIGGFDESDWVYKCVLDKPMEKGIYSAVVMVESVAPISFVIN